MTVCQPYMGVNMGLIRYLRRRLHIQQVNDVCDSTHQIVDKCLKEICSNGGGGIQAKLDQTIQIQKNLKETGEAILQKAEQNTEYQQLKDQCVSAQNKIDDAVRSQRQLLLLGDEISSKSDQALTLQQDLSRKADQSFAQQKEFEKKTDQVIAGQQDLKKKAEQSLAQQQELVKKSDQALAVQQELKKKAEQAATLQLELGKKSDQTATVQQDIVKKADQVLAGQKLLNDSAVAAQSKLDQISAGQKQCVNEIEFSRMSRTMFSSFRYWEDNFYNAIKGTDIEERYDRLVSGLSNEDKTTVDSMIGRIQNLCEKGDRTCYLPEEAERIYRNRKENLRIVRLNDHCFVYRGYKLPINLFEISTFACNYGLDLIEHPEYSDGKDIIDAGAYIGDSALVFDRYFSKCRRIYAFEPDASSYALMEKTIAMNKKSNIIPVAMGLGDSNSDGELTSHGMGSNLLDRRFGKEPQNDRTIRIVRLDDYVKQNDIVTGVIKTDLEGFEMHFLRGALETIKKDRPILVLSIYHSADDFFGIKPFIEDLDLGYRFRLFKADDGMILGGTCLICIPE